MNQSPTPKMCTAEDEIAFNKIKRSFGSSAHTYKNNAQLQYDVGNHLLSLLAEDQTNEPSTLLDLGCGPGLFTKELQLQSNVFISLDLSQTMLKTNVHSYVSGNSLSAKVQANSHALPFQANSFDKIFSSLMVQWCDLSQVLQQVHSALKKGGTAYISTLVKGSLNELEYAWSQVDSDAHIHGYLSRQQVNQAVGTQLWSKINVEQQSQTYWFASAVALAKELKSLGANYVENRQNKGLTSKTKWQLMEKAYADNFFDNTKAAIPATYQVVYLQLTK